VSGPALKIDRLVKRYGDFTAVDGISFEVARGAFFGLLGPNGAGKTTTINAIVGLAHITSGSIALFGHDVVRDWRQARRHVGLAPQEYNFDRYLNIRDVLIYQAGYYGLRGAEVARRADALLERFDLSSKAKQPYTRLSGGMKRRLSLARALIHEPPLVILDEPTAGVDVELRRDMWQLVRRLRDAGTTIILTTHYLEEAEEMADRVGVIDKGELILVEDKKELMLKLGKKRLTLILAAPIEEIPATLSAYPLTLSPDKRELVYHYDNSEHGGVAALLIDLVKAGVEVKDLRTEESSLEDIFVSLIRRAP